MARLVKYVRNVDLII